MKKCTKLFVFSVAMLIAQTSFAQEKRDYRDIAFDYLLQNISSIESRPWRVKADHYDKLSNGGYLVKLTISRTLTRQENRLVNNQVQAYGATFNVGVRNATVNIDYEDTKSYFVFVDRFGEASKYLEASTNHEFHSWGGNAWLIMNKHTEMAGNKKLNYYSNAACFSNKGETMWLGRDMKIYGWAFSGSTLYMAGTLWDNGRSIVRSINIKTLESNDKIGNSGVIPSGITFGEKGLNITQYTSNGQSSEFVFPYAASDRQFQIEQVLKSYDLTRASDQIALGERYLNGNVVDKNEKKAVELFEKATNQNSDIGMLKLARCYKKGIGVAQNNAKAISLYERASNMGNTEAMLDLSDIYAVGDGVTKNVKKALYWKERLAFGGNLEAQKYILANQSIEYEKVNLNADKLLKYAQDSYSVKNYEWAKLCYERAISQGSKEAMLDYGKWLYEGNSITKDYDRAIEYLSKLGEENNLKAQKQLITIYKENKGVAPDIKKEIYWTNKAAENGDMDSQFHLGQAYKNGIGVKKDKKLAFAMFEKSAEQGNQEAINEIVYCYANGFGVKKNTDYAVYWFKRMDAQTQLETALCFKEGIGVKKNKKNYAAAMVMYEHIVKENNATAGYKLVEFYIQFGRYDEAERLLADISKMPHINHTDNYSVGSYYMGMIWEKRGRTQQALNCYQNSNLPEAKQRYESLKATKSRQRTLRPRPRSMSTDWIIRPTWRRNNYK